MVVCMFRNVLVFTIALILITYFHFVLIVLTANSDIYKHGIFGSELHISGRLHLITYWVTALYFVSFV